MRILSLVVVVVVMAAACGGGDDHPPFVDPGSPDARRFDAPIVIDGDPVDARVVDAGPADAQTVTGRVCVVSDLRSWTTGCDDVDAGGLTVTIGSSSTTTAADGAFTMGPPSGANLRITVTGAAIVRSVSPYDPLAASQWAVAPTVTHWTALAAGTSFDVTAGNGTVMVHVTVGGSAAAAVQATAMPVSTEGVFYSSAEPLVWPETSSNVDGKVLVPDLPAGPDVIRATRPAAMAGMKTFLIEPDTITFGYINLTPTP